MIELKPCPFCGAKETDADEPLVVFYSFKENEWKVECERCGANTCFMNRNNKKEAVEAWNKRPITEEADG